MPTQCCSSQPPNNYSPLPLLSEKREGNTKIMAKTVVEKIKAAIKPTPTPKPGDTVNYVWPVAGNKIGPAKVAFVHEGHEGRLLNLEAQDEKGGVPLVNVPWRDFALDDVTGNSWHWPDQGPEAEESH
jgi:hypothetical protein